MLQTSKFPAQELYDQATLLSEASEFGSICTERDLQNKNLEISFLLNLVEEIVLCYLPTNFVPFPVPIACYQKSGNLVHSRG